MTLTLDPTPGGSSANTYAVVADLDAYVDTIPSAFQNKYATTTVPDKNAALAEATRLMDGIVWTGTRTTASQALQWPRAYVVTREGWGVDATTIPAKVKTATCALAFRLLWEDRAADAGAIVPDSLEIGTLKINKPRHQPIPFEVKSIVREFIRGGGGGVIEGERG
jgi:hypothetical protein